MKTLKFKIPTYLHRWKDDVDRIVKICAANGYFISETDAQHAWEEYSDSMCAGWLFLGNDDDVFNTVMQYCEEVDHGI